jgi:hypothetical protein
VQSFLWFVFIVVFGGLCPLGQAFLLDMNLHITIHGLDIFGGRFHVRYSSGGFLPKKKIFICM